MGLRLKFGVFDRKARYRPTSSLSVSNQKTEDVSPHQERYRPTLSWSASVNVVVRRTIA